MSYDVEKYYFLRANYFTWVAETPLAMIPGEVLTEARRRPGGTVRILYPLGQNKMAFVNRDPERQGKYEVWEACDGCYAVEEQCPLHGTVHGATFKGGRILGY